MKECRNLVKLAFVVIVYHHTIGRVSWSSLQRGEFHLYTEAC